MRGRTALILAAVLTAVGAYGVADAADVAPGVLTTAPPPPGPQPYPGLDLPSDGLVPAAVPGTEPGAPVPSEQGLRALAGTLDDDYRMTGDVAMVVTDVATGQVLMSQDGDTPRTTASAVKLLTAVAALSALGEDRVLTTRVVRADPSTVVLVGGGDVLLAAGEGDPQEVNGRAGLTDLAAATAEELRGEGTERVRVLLDTSLFTGSGYAEDWGGVDLDYVMPVQPLAVDTGRTDVGYQDDPALTAAHVFAEALREQGVEVAPGIARDAAPAGAETLAEVTSAPVGGVVRHMLKSSDNSVAEVLGRLVAVERGAEATFEGAAAAVQGELRDLGIDLGDTRMVETSGLSVQDRAPAGVLADVVMTALSGEDPSLRALAAALPVAGLDGTLADRMREEPAAGMVRAKTGTLIETVSLAGSVVTADGRELVFAVLANDLQVGTARQARLAVDDWASRLSACGCR